MVRILDRYVLTEITAPFVIGVGVFTFFLVIDRIYQLTDLVISKGVPFPLVLGLLVYMLPAFLTFTLPMAIVLAVLLAAGRLSSDLEATALGAAGVSPLRLARPFLVAAVAVTAASALLTLVANPLASRALQRQLLTILQTRAASALKERVFNSAFGRVVIYVDEIGPSPSTFQGLLVSDERDPKIARVVLAREGRLLSDKERSRVTLRFLDGTIAETETGDLRRFRHTAFALYDMTLSLDTPLATPSRFDKPERELAMGALVTRVRELKRQGQASAAYDVELHKRFALPCASLLFVLVGYPLGIRSRRGGRGAALGSSLGVMLAYYMIFTACEGMALRGRLPPWVAIWLPNALFLLVGLGLLGSLSRPWGLGLAGRAWALRGAWARRARGARRPERRAGRAAHGARASTFIMDRYVLRQYVAFLGAGLAIGAVLFMVGDLLQTLDRLLRLKPPAIYILQHFLLRLPGALHQGLPVVVLVATVFLFLSLTRHRELDALKAAGVSLFRVSLPVLVLAAGISLASAAFQELVLPEINARAEELDHVKIRGNQPRHLQRQSRIWYRGSDARFYRMELLDPVEQSLHGLLVLELDEGFRVRRRIDARRAHWTSGAWELSDGVLRERSATGESETRVFETWTIRLPETLADFTRAQKPPEAMSFTELSAYVARLQESGRRAGRYVVDLYAKLAFPLVHLIMALVAIPFALASPSAGSRVVGIGVAIAIAVGYWVIHSMALSLARAELLPPALAAWAANVVFAGLGATLFARART